MNGEKVCELKCKYNLSGICTCYGLCIAKDLIKEELEEKKFWKEINVNDLIVEELEKIKAEILEYHSIKCYGTCDNCQYKIIGCIEPKDVIEDLQILDKHIKENKK